jgi:long-subunit acyl-CoA synthetase (AMP-forming)
VLTRELEAEETEPAPVSEFGKEILILSSGTSGRVKICAYTALEFYFQISDSCRMVEQCALLKKHYECRLKLLALLPFYHIFGLTAVYLWFSFFSRTFVHLSDLSPETVVNTIKRHKVTHIFAVPLFWEKVYKAAIKTIKKRGEKTYAKFCKAIKIRK